MLSFIGLSALVARLDRIRAVGTANTGNFSVHPREAHHARHPTQCITLLNASFSSASLFFRFMDRQHCSPDLPVIEPLGPQILATFSFSPERSTMHVDVVVLVCLAFGLAASSLLIFFYATRCALRLGDIYIYIYISGGGGVPIFVSRFLTRGAINSSCLYFTQTPISILTLFQLETRFGNKLLGFSIGRGLGALKGLKCRHH